MFNQYQKVSQEESKNLQEESKLKSQKSIILFLFGRGSQAELKPNRCMALRQAEDFKWAQVPRFFYFFTVPTVFMFSTVKLSFQKEGGDCDVISVLDFTLIL